MAILLPILILTAFYSHLSNSYLSAIYPIVTVLTCDMIYFSGSGLAVEAYSSEAVEACVAIILLCPGKIITVVTYAILLFLVFHHLSIHLPFLRKKYLKLYKFVMRICFQYHIYR